MLRHICTIVLAALIAALVVAHTASCGDDFFFHLQSWFDAAYQFRHGNLHPHWLFHAAYNAGEPRFVFYPPLSWELGGLLALALPFGWVPSAMAFVVFCIAGLSTFALVRKWASDDTAALAGCVFLANPYLLLDLFSRAAYGQLLATAFFPLLLGAILRRDSSPWRLGLPLALMWLSNVPLGILGTYLFVLLGVWRIVALTRSAPPPGRRTAMLTQVRILAGGLLFGFTLPAFFLVPAIWERRYIRMQDAFLPRLRVSDNFLGNRHLDPIRDAFLLLTRHVAELLVIGTVVLLALASWRLFSSSVQVQARISERKHDQSSARILLLTTMLLVVVTFLVTFVSAPLWKHLPALWVVQFPWRLLFVLGLCLAIAFALLARNLRLPRWLLSPAAIGVTLALTLPASRRDFRACDYPHAAQSFADGLARNHTLDAVNEYVIAGGDNGAMRPDNPPFWLTDDPQAFAPGTTPNLCDIDPNAEAPEAPPDAHLKLTSLHFDVHAPRPEFLVINLQDYARWQVHAGGSIPPHVHRTDGLVAIPVPAGDTAVNVQWRRSWDEPLGWLISAAALGGYLWSRLRGRRRFAAAHTTVFLLLLSVPLVLPARASAQMRGDDRIPLTPPGHLRYAPAHRQEQRLPAA